MGPTGPTSSWRPFGPLSALRAGFWPSGPANTNHPYVGHLVHLHVGHHVGHLVHLHVGQLSHQIMAFRVSLVYSV